LLARHLFDLFLWRLHVPEVEVESDVVHRLHPSGEDEGEGWPNELHHEPGDGGADVRLRGRLMSPATLLLSSGFTIAMT